MIISGDEQNPLKYFKSFGDIANGILLIFWLFIAYITTLGNRCDRALYSGKYCYGKTPMQTFKDSKKLAVEKNNEILYLDYISNSHNLSDIQI